MTLGLLCVVAIAKAQNYCGGIVAIMAPTPTPTPPATPTIGQCIAGLQAANGAAVQLGPITVTSGQSLVLVHKGVGGADPGELDTLANTWSQASGGNTNSQGQVNISYVVNANTGSDTVTANSPGGGLNNFAILCTVNNLAMVDLASGFFSSTAASSTQSGNVQAFSSSELALYVHYVESASATFSGSSTNITGAGTPTDFATLGGTSSNTTQIVWGGTEPETNGATIGIQRSFAPATTGCCTFGGIVELSSTLLPATSVGVSCSPSTVNVGGTSQCTATATLTNGTQQTVNANTAWNSNNPTVASINTAGLVTGSALGTATITGTYNGVSGQTTVTVATQTTFEDEFIGPFSSWKTVTNANGSCAAADASGATDSSAAIQCNITAAIAAGSGVVYFPAGNYHIGTTLTVSSGATVSLIGADPTTTSLIWTGGTNGTLLNLAGTVDWTVNRLTFNGNNVAGITLAVINTSVITNGYFADDIFLCGSSFNSTATGVSLQGIQSSQNGWWRNAFQHCGNAFINAGTNQNVQDEWVWYSRFDDNNFGITTAGYGVYSSYGNYFTNSHTADLVMPNAAIFPVPVRNNVSIGSRQFIVSSSSLSHTLDISGNRIVNTTAVPSISHMGNSGSVLLDNKIRNDTLGPPFVSWNPGGSNSGLISLGNQYSTLASAENVGTAGINSYVQVDATQNTGISTAPPTLPFSAVAPNFPLVPPNNHRTFACDTTGDICDLAPGTAETTIQTHINNVCNGSTGSNGAVIHLQGGVYSVTSTLSIPTNCDVQILGDGNCDVNGLGSAGATELRWAGTSGGTTIQIHGHSKATLTNLCFTGSGFDAIHVNSADVPGSRIQIIAPAIANITSSSGSSFQATGLANTAIMIYSGLSYFTAGYTLNVSGNGTPGVPSLMASFSHNVEDVCGANSVSAHVTNQGQAALLDTWNEGNAGTSNPNCANSDYIVYENTGDSGSVDATGLWGVGNNVNGTGYNPLIYLNGFNGIAGIGPASFGNGDGNVISQVTNDANTTSVNFGLVMPAATGSPYYNIDTTQGTNSSLGLAIYSGAALPNAGTTTAAQIRTVFALRRAASSNMTPNTALPAGVDDVRITRITVRQGPNNGVVIVNNAS